MSTYNCEGPVYGTRWEISYEQAATRYSAVQSGYAGVAGVRYCNTVEPDPPRHYRTCTARTTYTITITL